MQKSIIQERSINVLRKVLDQCPHDKFTLDANLVADLGADSLDFIEIIMAIEEEFDIEIDDGDAERCKTISDVVGVVADLKGGRP